VGVSDIRLPWNSIRTKLVALCGMFILGASLAVGFTLYWQSRSALEAELVKRGRSMAKNLGQAMTQAMSDSDLVALSNSLKATCGEGDIAYAFVQSPEGDVIASEVLSRGLLREVSPLIAARCWRPLVLRMDTFVLPSVGKVYNFSLPVHTPQGFNGRSGPLEDPGVGSQKAFSSASSDTVGMGPLLGVVRVGVTTSRTDALVRAALKKALLVGAISVGLGIAALFLSLRLFVVPLSAITQVARRISSGDLTARVEVHGSGEFAELGKTVNEMAESLARSQEEVNKATRELRLSLSEKAELFREASEKASRLEMLNELSRSMASTLDRATLLRLVSRHLPGVVGCEYCIVAIYDKEKASFKVEAVHVKEGSSVFQPGAEIPSAGSSFEKAMASERPVLSPRLSDTGFPDEELLSAGGFVSGLVCPIVVEKQFLGVVRLASVSAEAFASDQIDLAGSVARTLGLALKNAQLYSDLQQSFGDLEKVQQKLTDSEKLRQAEKLKAVGQMASGIAHDFNNMLASILGRIQLLRRKRESGSISVQEELRWMGIIERAALDGAETIRRIQQYGKEEVEKRRRKTDLNEIVTDAIEITKPRWKDMTEREGRTVELKTELGAASPVLCVPSEIREVITNLIFNAVDAMPEGGTLEIRTGQEEEEAFVSVRDTGEGMDEEVKKRVFEPFYTTKGAQGTGLGLSMAVSVVKNHRGRIELESEPGEGSCFTVFLPTSGAVQSELQRETAGAASDAGGTEDLISRCG